MTTIFGFLRTLPKPFPTTGPWFQPGSIYQLQPNPVPPGLYATVTSLPESVALSLFRQEDGSLPDVQLRALQITAWGEPDLEAARMEPLYRQLKQAHQIVTEHPGLPPLVSVRRSTGNLPPTFVQEAKRAMCAVRVLLTYVE